MANKKFLIPLAAAVAALAPTANATTESASDRNPGENSSTKLHEPLQAGGEIGLRSGDDLFKFVLRRGEDGDMVAYHHSHSSHASHRSHYSSR